jgi:mannose-1-phosphate guanylyltransferase
MKAVVLAGGEGTRLHPLTLTRPKPMLPVAGRPCLDYLLRALVESGADQLILTTAHHADALIRAIGDASEYDASLVYAYEATPVGTAGSVKRMKRFLDETFVVAMGDVLADVDARALVEFHKQSGATATIALTQVDDPSEYGVVDIAEDGRIRRFQEKPKREEAFSTLINAGIYVLEPEVLDLVPEKGPFDFGKQVFPLVLERGLALYGKPIEGIWMDIGRPRDLLQANLRVIERDGSLTEVPSATCRGPVIFAPDAHVAAGATVEGPAYLGPGSRVGPGAHVTRSCLYDGGEVEADSQLVDSVLLESVRVGHGSHVSASVLSRDCVVGADSMVERCVLGAGASVERGTKLVDASLPPA